MTKPLIALTMGDVAGIGPEVIVRACSDQSVQECCRPLVVGHTTVLARAAELIGFDGRIEQVDQIEELGSTHIGRTSLVCWNPGNENVTSVLPGQLDPRSGQAAYDYLISASRAALEGKVDALTTAPLNKAALRSAGLNYPGHTEILADVCGVDRFAMMLYLPPGGTIRSPHGLGVAHVTLHTSLASVPELLSEAKVLETIELIATFMADLGCAQPRIGVCALNPHAGEEGLFGNEESLVIAPAVAAAKQAGLDVRGPLPADTLFRRAVNGEFDGVAAMYHDQGHIAFKLIGFDRAVNVTLGLPIVRTSPSHGTAFDIAWKGTAQADGMIEAIRVAALLTRKKRKPQESLA
ncbi:MAG: 4-hydroxythreonine-4-phosphate dehydrogenase PdxA [Planctomycetes bacterium]|nr:4-hydroxythreonine-4-phosphate dehydrogenase PdxA [Planctomycetota bacterium]